jgi:hypothetical protein
VKRRIIWHIADIQRVRQTNMLVFVGFIESILSKKSKFQYSWHSYIKTGWYIISQNIVRVGMNTDKMFI